MESDSSSSTPLASVKSPSELFLNKQIRVRFDALRPTKLEQSSTTPVKKTKTVNEWRAHSSSILSNTKPYGNQEGYQEIGKTSLFGKVRLWMCLPVNRLRKSEIQRLNPNKLEILTNK